MYYVSQLKLLSRVPLASILVTTIHYQTPYQHYPLDGSGGGGSGGRGKVVVVLGVVVVVVEK